MNTVRDRPGADDAIALLNTRRGGPAGAADASDALVSFGSVKTWALSRRLITKPDVAGGERARKTALDAVLRLREALEQFLEKRDARHRKKLLNAVSEALAVDSAAFALTWRHETFLETVRYVRPDPLNVAFAAAVAIADLLGTTDLHLVKRCAASDCIWYFIDTTKNHSRRWCTPAGCGARARARKYYHKA